MTHASLLIVANYWVEAFPSGSWGEKNTALRVQQLGFISRFESKTKLFKWTYEIFEAVEKVS